MRGGRSHRLPSNEPPDDWGDGSWTVDCVCGVNFDDGEEMVNCDECGVWVHTRCSRFVKGETSFACDKCKSKKNRSDNEETEVARLLVELPTKTMRMENPFSSSIPPRPFRLWTDIPIEERVHVHGVPGGDPTLFQGLSSIFTRELWSCTGYVPKKFNFQYREFPCWDEKHEVDAKPLEVENPFDKGADTLFSLSKEVVSANPVDMLVGLRGSVEGGRSEGKSFPKEMKKREGKDSSGVRMQNSGKRERNHARPLGGHLGKRKKDDVGEGKDQSMTKKATSFDKEADGEKKVATPDTEARKVEFDEDQCFKVFEPDCLNLKNGVSRESILPKSESDDYHEARKDNHSEDSFKEVSKPICPTEIVIKSEKLDCEVPSRTGSGPVAPSLVGPSDIGCVRNKEEDFKTATNERHNLGDLRASSSTAMVDSHKLKHPVGDLIHASPEVQDGQMPYNQNCRLAWSLEQPNIEQNIETGAEQLTEDSNLPCSSHDGVKMDTTRHLNHHQEISAARSCENRHETDVASCPSDKHKAQDVESELDALSHCNKDDPVEERISVSGDPCQNDQGSGSSGALVVRRSSSDPKLELRNAEPSKAGGVNHSSVVPVSRSKLVPGIGKSSTSSSLARPKSVSSGCCKPPARPASPNTARYINSSKQRVKVNSYADVKKDNSVNDRIRDDARHETTRRTAKEQLKGSQSSRLKASDTSKTHVSTAKRTLSDSKDQVLHPSSKPAAMHNAPDSSGSGESASSLQTAQLSQSKATSSGFSQKGERSNQSSSQHSSKVNQSSSMHPATPVNSSLTLSDEELALLLHQELNSSPRVPRVPRVRQAGSMPPLASAAATSMLIKRTSSSGGKDQSSVSRKKSKEDSLKDSIRSSCERTDAAKKVDKTLFSSDQQSHEPVSDGSTKKETLSRSPEVQSSQKNMCITSTSVASSSAMEAVDQNLSCVHNSTKDISDNNDDKENDNACGSGGSIPRTLPGLIDEIMSRGNNISCRELCDAVLPHWDNLRKLNGERYAYSSHSQAVLDCLRNRNEWAQLVDRGPKTNAGKKRRKLDADPPLTEADGNEHDEGGTSQELEGKTVESHQEEFPKGKRKARKRRRLALKGRGINDVRKRQNIDAFVENDVNPFSHSSDEGPEGIFSEDEIQGTRKYSVGSEAASSSDEAGSV